MTLSANVGTLSTDLNLLIELANFGIGSKYVL